MANYSLNVNNQISVVKDLITRLIPSIGDKFRLELIDSFEEKDVYEIDGNDKYVVLSGNNSISLSVALNHYIHGGIGAVGKMKK